MSKAVNDWTAEIHRNCVRGCSVRGQPSSGQGGASPSPPAGWSATEGTLARELEIDGHGLHTGRRVHVRIVPMQAGGIVFRRLHRGQVLTTVAVDPARRHAQLLCTALRDPQGVMVRTVEHLLASFMACEIDHAVVELDAEEVPILDGSARVWLDALKTCGWVAVSRPKQFVRVLKPVSVTDGKGEQRHEMHVEPASHYALDVYCERVKGFDAMRWQGVLTPDVFAREIAASRSYGVVKWAALAIFVGYVRGMPILRGARPSCAAAILGKRVLGGMRWPDEFVRHRVLDMVGDLSFLGASLLGSVTALRPTHEMNYRLVAALRSTPDAWEWAQAQ